MINFCEIVEFLAEGMIVESPVVSLLILYERDPFIFPRYSLIHCSFTNILTTSNPAVLKCINILPTTLSFPCLKQVSVNWDILGANCSSYSFVSTISIQANTSHHTLIPLNSFSSASDSSYHYEYLFLLSSGCQLSWYFVQEMGDDSTILRSYGNDMFVVSLFDCMDGVLWGRLVGSFTWSNQKPGWILCFFNILLSPLRILQHFHFIFLLTDLNSSSYHLPVTFLDIGDKKYLGSSILMSLVGLSIPGNWKWRQYLWGK